MIMKRDRIYVDTSVIGGCLDEEFAMSSVALLEMARQRKVVLIVSDLLSNELIMAPEEVRALIEALPAESVEKLKVTPESEVLLEAYLKAKIVGRRSENDAHHVALATIARAMVILSWNFKNIVHFDKIIKFNDVNRRHGYDPVEIRTPEEYV
jgi:predicted nucleic acid-binding protein